MKYMGGIKILEVNRLRNEHVRVLNFYISNSHGIELTKVENENNGEERDLDPGAIIINK